MTTLRVLNIVALAFFVGCASGVQSLDTASVQTGEITMPHERRPTGDTWTLVYRSPVLFPTPFARVPRIQLSVVAIEAYSRNSGTFYRLKATKVTSAGFEFQVYGAYMNSFSNCTVSWVAIE